MRRFDARIILGGALVLFGGLLLLERIGILRGATDLFWGVLCLVGAGYFFYIFFNNLRSHWWAIIPGMALLGMGGEAVLPPALEAWDGALFLGSIGIAFWVVYLTDRTRWWGIIPGGVLLTLAVVSVLDEVSGMETGGLFFLGLGITFLLVALLPNPFGKTQWAYIPAAILIAMGVFLGIGSTAGLMAYLWPGVLILSGIGLLFFYFFKHE
jgi:hypothetical protein